MARIWRDGQKKNCFIYRLFAVNHFIRLRLYLHIFCFRLARLRKRFFSVRLTKRHFLHASLMRKRMLLDTLVQAICVLSLNWTPIRLVTLTTSWSASVVSMEAKPSNLHRMPIPILICLTGITTRTKTLVNCRIKSSARSTSMEPFRLFSIKNRMNRSKKLSAKQQMKQQTKLPTLSLTMTRDKICLSLSVPI